jgi:RND family efflux transporter MFP subunit
MRHEELVGMMVQEPDVSDIVGRTADGATPPVTRRRKGPLLTAAVLAALLGVGIYKGVHQRADAEANLAVVTVQDAVPFVEVEHPLHNATDQELVLPGQTMPFTDTPIYARTNGYLKRWYFDIGAHVRQGQLLAQIETPELDAQLSQARADFDTAQANARLAGITAQRTASLLKSQSVSTQERDNAAGAYNADQAIVSSRQAEVARLEELQSYENVYAPFDGEITARNTDVGDLINAGAGAPTTELFHMTATKTLRIFVAVPEVDSPAMQVGATPTITLDEYPDQVFHGRLVRSNGAINPASRTLLVEVDVDNPDGKLLPGAYVFVHFMLPGRTQSVTIPANALLFRSEGLRVGVVQDGKAQLVPITIGRDYGDRVEVLSGLHASDQIILNPSDSLISGAAVQVAANKPAGAA